jgi:hypothetical protein
LTPVVTLYTRPDCHLCDEAREAILALHRNGASFRLEEVNIESDPKLHAAYRERIPVCELDGTEVFDLHPDIAALRARLDTVRP